MVVGDSDVRIVKDGVLVGGGCSSSVGQCGGGGGGRWNWCGEDVQVVKRVVVAAGIGMIWMNIN